MDNRINPVSERTINETIQTGQYIRNSGNRLFRLEVTPTSVILSPLNQEGSNKTMNRKLFVQLYARKNYEQVYNPENMVRESNIARSVGATRFMV